MSGGPRKGRLDWKGEGKGVGRLDRAGRRDRDEVEGERRPADSLPAWFSLKARIGFRKKNLFLFYSVY